MPSMKGPARGPGMVLTLAAGYLMPGLVGAVLIWAAVSGRADLVLLVAIVALCIGLVMSRSLYTAGTMVAMLTIAVVLWWRAAATWNAAVVARGGRPAGCLAAPGCVAGSRAPRQDPGAGQADRYPCGDLTLMFALILGACSWWAGRVIVAGLH